MFAKSVSIGASAAIATVAVMATSAPAHAFSYFTPSGSNLDGDSINDIVTTPGTAQNFDLGLDLSLFSPGSLPSVLDILVSWDTSELAFSNASVTSLGSFSLTGSNSATFSVQNPTASNISFGSIGFQVLSGLTNDGLADFQTSFALGQVSPFLTNVVATQGVDTQPVPTPALLPGLVGLGVAALRRKNEESAEESA